VIAVDTNVLLRLIVGDDIEQLNVVEELLAAEDIYLLATVVLELEWVLRSRYRFDRKQISDALMSVFALPRVSVERQAAVEWAVGRYTKGGDFADFIHLACVPPGLDAFVSFDRAITSAAGPDAPATIRTLATG
jgi:predicted nucleic-acid-binding protein